LEVDLFEGKFPIAFSKFLSSIERRDGEKEERRSDYWKCITWSRSMIFHIPATEKTASGITGDRF